MQFSGRKGQEGVATELAYRQGKQHFNFPTGGCCGLRPDLLPGAQTHKQNESPSGSDGNAKTSWPKSSSLEIGLDRLGVSAGWG
jgi:hypothetical protein